MKHFICCLVAALVFGTVLAGQPQKGYFCVKPGTTLHYERYAPDGKHWWDQTMIIDSAKPKDDGSLECSEQLVSISN